MQVISKIEKSYEQISISFGKGLIVHEKKLKGKVTFYQDEMVSSLLTKKIRGKYKKLIEQLLFLLSVDDESGTAAHEALNQIEKFKGELRNKYRKFLQSEDEKQYEKELYMMEQEVKRKLYIFNHFHTIEMEQTQNRSR